MLGRMRGAPYLEPGGGVGGGAIDLPPMHGPNRATKRGTAPGVSPAFAGIAGRLRVVQELLVELAEVPALVQACRAEQIAVGVNVHAGDRYGGGASSADCLSDDNRFRHS